MDLENGAVVTLNDQGTLTVVSGPPGRRWAAATMTPAELRALSEAIDALVALASEEA